MESVEKQERRARIIRDLRADREDTRVQYEVARAEAARLRAELESIDQLLKAYGQFTAPVQSLPPAISDGDLPDEPEAMPLSLDTARFKDMKVGDIAETFARENRGIVGAAQVARVLMERGKYSDYHAAYGTAHPSILPDKRFERAGKGTFRLKNWQVEPYSEPEEVPVG